MNSILGQETLINTLISLKPFPKVLLLCGDIGSGKHLVANYIADNILKCNILHIEDDVNFDNLLTLQLTTKQYVCLINTDLLTEHKQNMLLKFLEEPPINAYIILLTSNKMKLLPTILNRVVLFNLNLYTKDVLVNFLDMSSEGFDPDDLDLILSVCKTPGQLININTDTLSDIKRICNTIITSLDKASFPNTMTIGNKFNYSDEYDKFDINLFFKILLKYLANYPTDKKIYSYYNLTREYYNRLNDSRLNKKHLIDNYLTKLWGLSRV